MNSLTQEIFKTRSSTFYPSAKFFPPKLQEDVTKFYSFVRVADDYVDQSPPRLGDLQNLYKAWQKATPKLMADPLAQKVVQNMLDVQKKYAFEPKWVESFFDSMFLDVRYTKFETLADSLKYVHGSGEVIGLMMAKMMDCGPASYEYAQLQGRAWQWLNFIRGIKEDNRLGRVYFPAEDLARFSLADLSYQTAKSNPIKFGEFINFQLKRYEHWQKEAKTGYEFISATALPAIRAAAEEYEKIAQKIAKNPRSVF